MSKKAQGLQVILLEPVGKLGKLGDLVTAKRGFIRNYLFPQGKAIPATEANIAEFEKRRAVLEQAVKEKKQAAETRATQLVELAITIEANASEEGRLFGSVDTHTIAEAITAAGVAVSKSEVRLPEGVIRELGEYQIAIQLHPEVTESIKLTIINATVAGSAEATDEAE